MSIKNLSKETVRIISSGQVITSITSVVKELVENSIDAKATNIECKLVGGGFTSIIVKDNGIGIPLNDRQFIGHRHCTSKLPDGSFDNISKLTTYGFRGEALNSICTISQSFSIETRTKEDIIGKMYNFDHMGNIVSETPTNTTIGTTVQIIKIFYNTPVRKQAALKKSNNTIKSILEMLTSYALIYPNIRFSFKHSGNISNKISKRKVNATFNNNNVEWHSIICNSTMDSIKHLFGSDLTSQLQSIKKTYSFDNEESDDTEEESIDENNIKNKLINEDDNFSKNIEFNAILYKPNVDPEKYWRSSTDRIFFYVNKRPIQLSLMPTFKEILKLIKQKSFQLSNTESSGNKKYPFVFLDITLPTNTIDINIEPSKMKIMFHYPQRIIDLIDKLTDEIYPPPKLNMEIPLIFKPIEQLNIASDISSFSKADKHINNIIKDQQLEKISFINKEKTNCTANFQNIDSSTIKTYEIRNQKFIDNDISNFLLMQNNTSVLEKDTVERKQSIKRRKLNLSTIDYTTEKFVDIKSCKNNYHKVRLNKNKIYSKNIRIIGFLSSNTGKEQNIEYNENNDKYDQFWVIKDDKQLIVGSWKRINEVMIYQQLLKTMKIPTKEKMPPMFYELNQKNIAISNTFIYERSDNENVKKIINSFITLNGYEAWFHKYNNTIEIRKIPNIPDEYNYSGSINDFEELITNNIHINESIVTQTKTLNEYQRPQKFCNYLKSILPLWCLPNIPLNDISSSHLSSKISKENLKEILQYIFSDINKNLNPSLKYEGLISPKSKKYVAKSIFKI